MLNNNGRKNSNGVHLIAVFLLEKKILFKLPYDSCFCIDILT